MLPMWLAPIHKQMDFKFNVDFEYDIKMAKKKEKLLRRAEGLESDLDMESDSDDYDSEEAAGEGEDQPE